MPNWCQNNLAVTGETAEVERFLNANASPENEEKDARLLSFEQLAPTPPDYLTDGGDRWYDWRVANWGTKWDAASADDAWDRVPDPEQPGVETASLSFDTAWSPPVEWLARVGQAFPELTLRLDYVEHGMGFSGYAVAEEGYFGDHETAYVALDEDDPDNYF